MRPVEINKSVAIFLPISINQPDIATICFANKSCRQLTPLTMATTAQNPLPSSPTSSYDIISRSSGSVDSDDDEIVWSPSSGFLSGSESSNYLFSEDDFVVLSHSRSSSTAPRPDTEATTELASELALKLSVGPKVTHGHSQRGGRGHQKKQSQPPACPAPTSTASAIVDTNQTFTGLGSRSIVDDFSESASIADSDLSHTMYEDAVEYISSYVATFPNQTCVLTPTVASFPTPLRTRPTVLPSFNLLSSNSALRHHHFLHP